MSAAARPPGLLDWLGYLIARLGWPGLAGLALGVAAATGHYALTPALQAEAEQLAGQAERAAARRAAAPVKALPPSLAERLPGDRRTPEAVARLFAAAAEAQLAMDEGEYKLQGEGVPGLQRYQITLPMQGRYPALRGFLAGALNGNPTLALDGINLSRESVESAELQAVLRFTLYLRGEGR